jgi:hypothetical protein
MKNDKALLSLLTPSWVVNFIGVTLAVLVTAGTIVLSQYQGSELRRQIFEVQNSGAISSDTYDNITTNIADNSFLNALPLLIVWACVGLVVYYFAVAIIRALGQAVELHDELEYVHVSREARMREALTHLGIRAILIIGWFIFIKLSLSVLVPYALASANVASRSWSISSAGYALLSAVMLYAIVYGHAIFLRLIALRTRMFGTAI